MRKTKTKKSFFRHPRILISVGILVITLAAGSVYVWHHHTKQLADQTAGSKNPVAQTINNVNYGGSSAGDNSSNNARKGSSSPASTLDNGPSPSTGTSSLSATINATLNGASSSNLHIGTLVNGATTGTCIITATQGQTTTTLDTVSVAQDVNNYDCGGGAINLSSSQLSPSSGTWQIKLSVTSGNAQTSTTTSVTFP